MHEKYLIEKLFIFKTFSFKNCIKVTSRKENNKVNTAEAGIENSDTGLKKYEKPEKVE